MAGCGRLPGQAPPPTAVRIHRLGFLSGGNAATQAQMLAHFRQALADLGYVEGRNLAIEYRWGDGNDDRLAEPAVELGRLPVDVLVVPSTVVAQIALEAAVTVPIVLAGSGRDPVSAGIASSYARPGGMVTGVTDLGQSLFGKRIQLLKDAVPSISHVAVLRDPAAGPFPTEAYGPGAKAVGVQLIPLEPHGPEEFVAAFEVAAHDGADALMVVGNPLAGAHRAQIIQLAAHLRWPAMYYQRRFVDEGGLMTYTASQGELWRRAAYYVDRILKGTKPADLPIEQPMTFDFVVNLKTARELGITFPQEILLQVTEVVE
jgi:putative ABC transport system substrate-binding protein